MDWNPEWTKPVLNTVMVGIGSALIETWRAMQVNKPIRIARLAVSSALSMFIGFHMIYVYRELGLSDNMIGAMTGLSAVLGIEFMLWVVERVILKRMGISYEQRIASRLMEAGWTPPAVVGSLDSLQSEQQFAGVPQSITVPVEGTKPGP